MITFNTAILKFGSQGEKTGWTYIKITADLAQRLKPGNNKSFRVSGFFDDVPFKQIAMMPFGGGDFILALNAQVRRQIGKGNGATLRVKMEVDDKPIEIPAELMECLADEPQALQTFESLAKSHQTYFIRYIQSAKTDETKAKRIAQTVNACSRKMDYGQMIREAKQNRIDIK